MLDAPGTGKGPLSYWEAAVEVKVGAAWDPSPSTSPYSTDLSAAMYTTYVQVIVDR
jgi:hypothetical protein